MCVWLRIGPVADSYEDCRWTFAFHRQQEISCGIVLYFFFGTLPPCVLLSFNICFVNFPSRSTVFFISLRVAFPANFTLQNSQPIYRDIILSYQYRWSIFDGARGGVVVKALRYKPAGRGFDSRWCHWNFSLT